MSQHKVLHFTLHFMLANVLQVCHFQKLNKTLLSCWIICEETGDILCAHCTATFGEDSYLHVEHIYQDQDFWEEYISKAKLFLQIAYFQSCWVYGILALTLNHQRQLINYNLQLLPVVLVRNQMFKNYNASAGDLKRKL